MYTFCPVARHAPFTRGPLLAAVSETHALTAMTAVMISALLIVGLIFRPRERVLGGLTWISPGLFALYVINTWILFAHGH